jgi:hypothetical protein
MSSTLAAQARPATRSRPGLAVRIAWSCVALYVVLGLIGIRFQLAVSSLTLVDGWELSMLLLTAVIGALIVARHAKHPIGWMFCGLALSLGLAFFAQGYAVYAIAIAPGSLPAGELFAWIGLWAAVPGIAVIAMFLPLLFPDGRLLSARWRPVAWIAGALAASVVLVGMIAPASYADGGFPQIRNPLGVEGIAGLVEAFDRASDVIFAALVSLSAVAVFLRLRNADAEERAQIKWFAYAAVLLLVAVAVDILGRSFDWLAPARAVLDALAITALPAAVGIAVLRYRLYDIDLIINRTVVYVLLTAILAGFYTGSVALFQRMFVATTGQGSDLAIVLTLFTLATVFTPIKNTLQERVDRRIKPTSSGRRPGIDNLVMLAELHRSGVLTDDEFAAKKKQVLGI